MANELPDKDTINGIITIDKEKNWTSHDVIAFIRNHFGIKKAGHGGTLDPNATGLLIVLLGNATKLSDTFLNHDKEYLCRVTLGETRDTGDIEGNILSVSNVTATHEEILSAIFELVGEIEQIPPMFSAKRHNGKRLYELARKGIAIERKPSLIHIKEIEIIDIKIPDIIFKVLCSKGTYIRGLAVSIGEKLSCGAYLSDLRRLKSGNFDLSKSFTPSQLKTMEKNKFYESVSRI
ncbi:tRNA pseudouridine synthase B [Candidatus Omnitrophus magneticus]|uniref:tRNA pseudouridine synthase B n=1 Tax=Candidatus Omnitrophus magneticus TaxID=1609969 RepID=A0A0F0CPV8_9BACT|nr:tRNA pseudouridine synthase B [Candidatus Omnitrophus magneticus]